MDLAPTPDQGPSSDEALSGWLAEVEGRLTAIDARLAALETSLRPAVAEEVQGATADLRRAMNELGRRLVSDLPHELARHRDAIVAQLRPPPPPPPPPPPAVVDEEPEPPTEPEPADDDADTGASAPDDDDDVRARRRRRRRG